MAARTSKTIWLLLLIAVIAVLVFVAAARPGRDRPVRVAVTHAVRRDLNSWTAGNGKIEPVDPHVIQSELTTRIDRMDITEGRSVTAGETLLVLDATDAKSELARTKEQLLTAQEEQKTALQGGSSDELAQIDNDLLKTNSDVARLSHEQDTLQRLYANKAATRQEIDQNRIAMDKAKADNQLLEEKKRAIAERSKTQAQRAALKIDEARESIQSLEQKINSARVAAPVSGTIYTLSAKAGTFVHTGDTLAEMADLRRLRARAFIDEPELGSLKEGQTVEITWDALPARIWTGAVEQLPKTIVSRGSRNVGEVLCSINNDEAPLLPNTNINVRIRTAKRDNVLTLPRAAIRSDGNRRFVFVIADGHLQKREVTVGISDPAIYEILSGIAEEDAVALQSDTDLREGEPVTGYEK
ncbi:MAG TPA: efflux RND transporter periplasmic adaptor subunit [Terriglobia bacterium]|jgi:HlyD family secretion protein